MDPDMDNLPTDYEQGTDFRLTKTQKGQYADYSTSSWSRKERSLNEDERSAIETHGLYDLNEFMPKRPTEDDMRVITEMFEASVDGELYDPTRWGQHYKPYGLDVPAGTSAPTPTPSAPKVEEVKEVAPAETTPVAETSAPTPAPATQVEPEAPKSDAADILAMIRSRKTD
jgi:cell division septation protein DedD